MNDLLKNKALITAWVLSLIVFAQVLFWQAFPGLLYNEGQYPVAAALLSGFIALALVAVVLTIVQAIRKPDSQIVALTLLASAGALIFGIYVFLQYPQNSPAKIKAKRAEEQRLQPPAPKVQAKNPA